MTTPQAAPAAAAGHVRLTTDGHVAVLTLDRPAKLNALTGEGRLVTVNMLDAAVAVQMQELSVFTMGGIPQHRGSEPHAPTYIRAPYGVFATADGHLALPMPSLHVLGEVLDLPAPAEMDDNVDGHTRRDRPARTARPPRPDLGPSARLRRARRAADGTAGTDNGAGHVGPVAAEQPVTWEDACRAARRQRTVVCLGGPHALLMFSARRAAACGRGTRSAPGRSRPGWR